MSKTLVSVIVPVYNVEQYLDECINSILNQTYGDIEIILVDDGSTDGCPDKCDTWAERDYRIKVYHKDNGGLMSAWVYGLKVAKGEYISFVDSDDWIDSDMIEVLVQRASEDQSDIIVCHYVREFADGGVEKEKILLQPGTYDSKKIKEQIFPILVCSGTVPERGLSPNRVTKMFKADLLRKNISLYNFGITIGEDLLTTFVNVISANRISIIGDFYPYHYRINNQSMTAKYSQSKYEKIRQLHHDMVKIDHEYGNVFSEQLANDYIYLILQQMECEILFSKYDVKRIVEDMRTEYTSGEFQNAILICSKEKLSFKNRFYLYLLKYHLERIFIMIRKLKS